MTAKIFALIFLVWVVGMFLGATYEYHSTSVEAGQVYTTGTATFTRGSATVTGAGTTWVSGMENGIIQLDADGVWCKIVDVVGNTELTLDSIYNGAGGSGTYTMATSLAWEGSSEGGTTLDYLLNYKNAVQQLPVFGGLPIPVPNSEYFATWFRVITLQFYFMQGTGYTMVYWIVLFPFAMLAVLSLIMLFMALIRGNITWG